MPQILTTRRPMLTRRVLASQRVISARLRLSDRCQVRPSDVLRASNGSAAAASRSDAYLKDPFGRLQANADYWEGST